MSVWPSSRFLLVTLALLGCGGGAPPADAPAPTPTSGEDDATTGEAEPDDAELEATLRATWAEHRARLEAAAEARDVETFLRETGREPPETMTEAQRTGSESAMRIVLDMLRPIEDDERSVRLLREGDRAALLLEQQRCDAGTCEVTLRILRFAREDGAWRARGAHNSVGAQIEEGRAAGWSARWLDDPGFALESPPPEPMPTAVPGS